jgi:phosphatidyl-myo-inositol dimannoside synthase
MASERPGRPKLLILTPDFPPAHGGIQTMSHRLAVGLRGFDKRVLTLDMPGASAFDRESGLWIRRVAAPQRGPGRAAMLNQAALGTALAFRPDVTLGIHIVMSPAAAVIRRVLRAPTVQYFHAREIGARPRLAAFAVRHADALVAVSAYTAGLIRGVGASADDIRLIPPGVDMPDGDASPIQDGPPTVLTIARMEERYKGHDVMVRAMSRVRARVPEARWVVIGEGPLRRTIEQLARAQGLGDSVRFLGAVSDEERARWLRHATVLAMPSRLPAGDTGEGFGIVYLEAGAYGKPVLAGNVGGAPDAVVDGTTGLLVDPTDPPAVAEGLVRLLLDGELAARLGSAGAERAREFAWPRIAERVEALLLEQARA